METSKVFLRDMNTGEELEILPVLLKYLGLTKILIR